MNHTEFYGFLGEHPELWGLQTIARVIGEQFNAARENMRREFLENLYTDDEVPDWVWEEF